MAHNMYYIFMYFKIKQNLYSILNLVGARMICEARFPFESFITLVALEWSLHSVRLQSLFKHLL